MTFNSEALQGTGSASKATFQIRNVEKRRVIPKRSVGEWSTRCPKEVQLSVQDLAMSKIYMHLHYIFSSQQKKTILPAISLKTHLDYWQEALEEALQQFPYFAGSIREDEHHNWILRNNLQGCELQGAESDQILGDTNHESLGSKFDENVSIRNPFIKNISEPLFAVKLTRYACGSLSVVTSTHHWLADFSSYMSFMKTIASKMNGALEPDPTIPPLDFSRQVSKLNEGGCGSKNGRCNMEILRQLGQWFKPISEDGEGPPMFKRPVSSTKIVCVHFTAYSLNKLKSFIAFGERYASNSNENTDISTMDALHIVLWSALTSARGLKSDISTKLMITMDGRSRVWNKKFAEGYFGNVHPGHTYEISSSLKYDNGSTEGLLKAAKYIRHEYVSQQATGPQVMQDIIEYQQSYLVQHGEHVTTRVEAMFGHDVIISNLSSYPLFNLNFGHIFGEGGTISTATMLGSRAVAFGPYEMHGADGTVTILPAGPVKSGEKHPDVVATIGIKEEDLPDLIHNDLLKNWGTVLY